MNFSALSEYDVVLTVNQRLVSVLMRDYEQQQCAAGKNVWQTPIIMALSTWLEQCYLEHCDQSLTACPLLLNTSQELALWRRIISDSPRAEHLLNIEATIRLAQQASVLVQHWQLTLEDLLTNSHLDCEVFAGWHQQFEQLLDQENYLTKAQLFDVIENSDAETITLAGFDQFHPALTNFMAQKPNIIIAMNESPPVEPIRHQFVTLDDEIRAIAAWAIENQTQRLGIIVPKLHEISGRFRQVFRDVFVAQSVIDSNDASALPFNLSGGDPLSDENMIFIVKILLQFSQGKIAFEKFSLLLRSPYITGDLSARSLLDCQLRENCEETINFRQLAYYCPEDWFKNFQQLCQQCESKMSAAHWADHFSQLLGCLGWPGERDLNSREFQVVEALKNIMAEFQKLAIICETMTRREAVQQFCSLLDNNHFQVQSDEVNIHILGILESSGIEFDKLWLMNLDDQTWPAPAKPHPFINRQLQQARNMPHASASRELEFSEQVMQRLYCQAKTVIVSSHQQNGNEILSVSPLIADLPLTENPLTSESLEQQLFMQHDMQRFTDDWAPEIADLAAVKGGTWLFKEQALCPFRAQAKFRLHADGIPIPAPGFTALERGILVHDCLEKVWQHLQNSVKLAKLDLDSEQPWLADIIKQTLQDNFSDYQRQAQQQFFAIEQQRLQVLLTDWLRVEQERPPFTVTATEQAMQAEINGLTIRTRIDRIDKITDGNYLIIDYKTGLTRMGDWFDERPTEPQLPLYAITSELSVEGIFFAQVRQGKNCFRGLCVDPELAPAGALSIEQLDDIDDWPMLKAQWQQVLSRLAEEYKTGYAAVDPKTM